MKYLISILLTLIFTILTVKVEAEETKNDRLTISSNLYLSSVSNNGTRSFVVGESLQTKQEKILADERLRRLATSHQTSQTTKGSSYTGQGQNVQIVGYSNEQCVIYFKRVTGYNASLGYAGNIKPNSQTPQIGSGALERGHISLVISIGDDWIRVRESNWIRGAVTERTINKSNIRGYLVI
jgi:hypothetical protein